MGSFTSKNVTLTLIMSKMNLKGPFSLKPTTVQGHTYPRLYLKKKKCAWEMTLLTFLKCYVDNLNPEFKKILASPF